MKKLSWSTVQRRVFDLIPYEKNPRAMTEDEVKHLTASIEKFNLVELPVIDLDSKIIAGHQRLTIMRALGRGEEMIDVRIPNRKLTPAEFDEYLIRSNKNTGHWDFDKLANGFEMPDLLDWGFKASELGIGDTESPDGETGELRFVYPKGQMEEVVERFKAVQEMLGVDTKEAALLRLLENAI